MTKQLCVNSNESTAHKFFMFLYILNFIFIPKNVKIHYSVTEEAERVRTADLSTST